MRIDEIKASLIRFIAEEAAKRAGTGPDNGSPAQSAPAPDALEIAVLSDEDAVVLSMGLKEALDILSAQEGASRADLSEKEIQELIKAVVKEKAAGGNRNPDAALKLFAGDIDLVTISREFKAVLKSAPMKAGEVKQAEVRSEPGSAVFLNSIISELLPGLRLRLYRVYKRKSRGSRRNQKGGEGGRKGSPGQGPESKKEYAEERVRFTSEGIVRGDDGSSSCYHFELNLMPEGGSKGCEISLDRLAVRYGGSREGLHDFRFAFEVDGAENGNGQFKGRGYGLFVIELVEIGSTVDGAPIYGTGMAEEDWLEEV